MEEFTIVIVRRANQMVYLVDAFKGHLTSAEAIRRVQAETNNHLYNQPEHWIIKHMNVSELD